MARICCFLPSHKILLPTARFHGVQCCSSDPQSSQRKQAQTPKFLKLAVTGVTELIRLFSPHVQERMDTVKGRVDSIKVSDIDDILRVIKSDYEKAYFVTGVFTEEIYADNCTFEDPTIKFQGRDLYLRNLKLLVPFFDNPSIILNKIEKVLTSDRENIVASWRLRTCLKLPWRPIILVNGKTVYDIDEELRVMGHVESWDISALQAVGQIFTPGFLSSSSE
ncbi:OLC1v1000817C1 [Oldenlandia corymbosa var. corymbosa]|uniref:OLC1v1000817C1 n=1 Tax=Oldenlandia corymbosa var. corymbosa TaxID=529605 RepID=A0AAV1D6C3_OLDCO|nr:OLC1v1000817C1 [Oldenlandia corymbosa var. corymbosa]